MSTFPERMRPEWARRVGPGSSRGRSSTSAGSPVDSPPGPMRAQRARDRTGTEEGGGDEPFRVLPIQERELIMIKAARQTSACQRVGRDLEIDGRSDGF